MIGQAPANLVSNLHQHTGVETVASVITLDIDLRVASQRCQRLAGQFAADAVDGGAKTDRDTVIDLIAQGGLQGDNLHLAVQAVRTALERVLIIADDAEGRIDTDTGVPAVVERGYQVAKGYYRVGHHIAVIAAGGNALRVVDIGLGEDGRKTTADFSSVQPGHTGGVAKQGAGVLGGG